MILAVAWDTILVVFAAVVLVMAVVFVIGYRW